MKAKMLTNSQLQESLKRTKQTFERRTDLYVLLHVDFRTETAIYANSNLDLHTVEAEDLDHYLPRVMQVQNPEWFLVYVDPEPFKNKELFESSLLRVVADRWNNRGFVHGQILWALCNCKDPEQVFYTKDLQKLAAVEAKKELKERLADYKQLKTLEGICILCRSKYYKQETFVGADGVAHGYTIYDLQRKIVYGHEVLCYGSWLYGGNCQCHNHKAGQDFIRPLMVEDVQEILADYEHKYQPITEEEATEEYEQYVEE